MSKQERITRAALLHNGVIHSVPAPGRHHDVILQMHRDHGLGPSKTLTSQRTPDRVHTIQ